MQKLREQVEVVETICTRLPADYNKLKNLIRLDKLDGDRKGISTNYYAATCSDIYMRRRIIIKR